MKRLLRVDPFPDTAPVHVRAHLYHYRFATRQERRETGAWWVRRWVAEMVPPLRLRRDAQGP
jgi:hypothetical protein